MKRGRRPYGYGQHLAAGLGLLWARWSTGLRTWATGGSRRGDTVIRGVVLAVAGLVAVRVLTADWRILTTALMALIAYALRTATAHHEAAPALAAPDTAADAVGEQDDDGQEEPPADPSPAEFLHLVHTVIGTARGVHLATLARALTDRLGGAWEVADVRRLCEAAGQPVRPTVRAPGAGPTVGIHRADLLPLPRPSATPPPEGVVAAGQPGTTPPATAPTTAPATAAAGGDEGLRIVSTEDPDKPSRTLVRVLAQDARRP